MPPLAIAAGSAVLAIVLVGVYLLERGRREVVARQIALLEAQREILANIAPALAGELRRAQEEHLAPLLGEMTSTLGRLARDVELHQREALAEMASSFRAQLTDGFRTEFDALARSLHEAAAWHQKVHRELGDLIEQGQQLGEGHAAMLRRTLQVSEAVRTNGDSLARAERSLELVANRVQASATALTKSFEGAGESIVSLLEEASREIARGLTEMTTNLNEQMDRSGDQFGKRLQGMTLMLQRVASEIDTLGREQRARPGGQFPRGF